MGFWAVLYWKIIPDVTLATEQQSGIKKEKAWMTVISCCNADGSHKLSLWLIGKAAKPRCFGRSKIQISSLDITWRHNAKIWINIIIMMKYLQWFDAQMIGWKVLLLLDNCSSHECAIDLLKEDILPLQNTRIKLLPVNTTSLFQLLDQGIIRNLKTLYQWYWLQFMVNISLSTDKNPMKEVNMLWACRWIINAWNEVQSSTINHCFCKSTLLGPY